MLTLLNELFFHISHLYGPYFRCDFYILYVYFFQSLRQRKLTPKEEKKLYPNIHLLKISGLLFVAFIIVIIFFFKENTNYAKFSNIFAYKKSKI